MKDLILGEIGGLWFLSVFLKIGESYIALSHATRLSQLILFLFLLFFFQNVNHNNKLRSKRGQLPFVEFNGEEIPDSEFIIQTLGEKLDKNMDAGMDAEQSTVQHAMVALVDNHLNW